MISPRNQQDETAVSPRIYQRTPLYLFVGMVSIFITALTLSGVLLNESRVHPLEVPINSVLAIATLVSIWFIWRGKVFPGTGLLAVTFFSAIGFAIIRRADVGFLLVIISILMTVIIIGYSWPERWRTVGILSSTAVGVTLLLIDLFWTGMRQAPPEIFQNVLLTATGIVVIAAIFLLVGIFNSFTIRTKLITTGLVITLVPLTIMALINQRSTRTVLINNANDKLQAAASQTAVAVDDFLRNILNDVRVEAGIFGEAYDWAYYRRLPVEERSTLGLLGETKAIQLLKTFRDKEPINIASYALLDMDGQVLFEYPPSENNPDESGQDYFQTVVETGQPYISPVEFSSENGEAYLHFSDLVFDDAGIHFGVLRVRYKASIIQALIARSTGLVGGQSFAVLFDENNLHLAHGTAPEAVYKLASLPTADRVTALQADKRLPNWPMDELSTNLPDLDENLNNTQELPFFTALDVATGDRINQAAAGALGEQPWQVIFFQPQDTFLNLVQSQNRNAALLVLILGSLVAAAAIVVANFIAQPILRLEAAATLVAQGDLTAKAQIESDDEVGALALTFNQMTAQLRDLIGNLELRVADRTRALEISSKVSQQLSTILDQQELVKAVVEQVQQSFDYYHAHIYLYDDARENLVMVGGTGEAGQVMLERDHMIPKGKGLVGRAGETSSVVLAPDVRSEPGWLPNQLLLETRAEIAVPIVSGNHVLGVLDVQHNVVGGLTQADASLLQTIASQVAVALQNARLYARMQQLAMREAQINAIGQRIQSTTTVEDAMQTAVRELGRVLKADQTRVHLKTENTGASQLQIANNGNRGETVESTNLENLP